ncbi:hypothetical protein POM88_022297 [Heracleum sosnowskyi]|uniref:BED-type domain-containing protein n=1 Tax=Heracleum sosnowskyi TaxID=360622 RepID=A0AAD8IER4_9APIA|nr:hypothetical protein POM88_022297 [Heracleum sosnowskyi]
MEQGNASGSASSNSVGMVSTKCAANMSKSDQDCTVLSQAQENDFAGQQKEQEQPKKKQKIIDAICKYCHQRFDGASGKGTTHLRNHTEKCRLRLVKVPVSQRLLGKQVSSDVCWCSVLRFLHPSLQFLDFSSAIAGQI